MGIKLSNEELITINTALVIGMNELNKNKFVGSGELLKKFISVYEKTTSITNKRHMLISKKTKKGEC